MELHFRKSKAQALCLDYCFEENKKHPRKICATSNVRLGYVTIIHCHCPGHTRTICPPGRETINMIFCFLVEGKIKVFLRFQFLFMIKMEVVYFRAT